MNTDMETFCGKKKKNTGDELFYYDPHFVKPRATPEELGTCPVPVSISPSKISLCVYPSKDV